jgi:hypothetical protein
MAGKFDRKEFLEPLLFVCESNADIAFVRAALEFKNKLTGYSITSSAYQVNGRWMGGGIDDMGRALSGFRSMTGFMTNVRHVVLVIDNDLVPATNFQKVQKQVADIANIAKPGYAVPRQPHVRASTRIPGDIDVTVLTIPGLGIAGCLESLLLTPAKAANPNIASCLEAYCTCVQVNAWPLDTKKDRIRIRCLLSAAHADNPDIGIGKIWIDAPHLIPIGDPSLQAVIDSLHAQQP